MKYLLLIILLSGCKLSFAQSLGTSGSLHIEQPKRDTVEAVLMISDSTLTLTLVKGFVTVDKWYNLWDYLDESKKKFAKGINIWGYEIRKHKTIKPQASHRPRYNHWAKPYELSDTAKTNLK